MGIEPGEKTIGYCSTPDLRDPGTMMRHVQLAAKAGFKAIWISDHFHPWYDTDAIEYNTWVWMSAALERVKNVTFATSVTAPILRYHPAIVAQTFATMELMFGRRVILGVGTGEALNEVPLGYRWPSPRERREMLTEAVGIIKELWTDKFVSIHGKYYTLDKARLYMRSSVPIYISAYGPRMAETVGKIGDGFITGKPLDYAEKELFPSLKKGAESIGKSIEEISKVSELDVSYGDDSRGALKEVRRWAGTFFPEMFISPISDPREIERRGETFTDGELAEAYLVGNSIEDHVKRIERSFRIGFDHVHVFNASAEEEKFIEVYKSKIIPYFHDGKK